MTYVDLTTLKAWLKITGTSNDALLDTARLAAESRIDTDCGRTFGNTGAAEVRTVPVPGNVLRDGASYERLLVPDIASASGFAVSGYGSVSLYPPDCFERGWPATSVVFPAGSLAGVQTVDVTAVWGWPAVPAPIAMACLICASRLYRRRGSPEGTAGSAEWGLVQAPFTDPDYRAAIRPYRMPGLG